VIPASGFLSLDSRVSLQGPWLSLLSDKAAYPERRCGDAKASAFARLITQSCNVCTNQRRPTRLLQ
jgi:hypothetical protein